MRQQHVAIPTNVFNALVADGYTVSKPGIEPFTLKTFNRWVEHPTYGMIPMYGVPPILTAIPIIDDASRGDELQKRALRALTYRTTDTVWMADTVLPMKCVADARLQQMIDATTEYAEVKADYLHYIFMELADLIDRYAFQRWGDEPWNKLEIIETISDPANRNDEPFSDLLDRIWAVRNKMGTWIAFDDQNEPYRVDL